MLMVMVAEKLIGQTGQTQNGLHLIMISRESQREFMCWIQLLINQEQIPLRILEIEELHFTLKEMINLKEPTKEKIN